MRRPDPFLARPTLDVPLRGDLERFGRLLDRHLSDEGELIVAVILENRIG